jgi:hypothetical protein
MERKFRVCLLHDRQDQDNGDDCLQEPHRLLGQQRLFKNTDNASAFFPQLKGYEGKAPVQQHYGVDYFIM